jgi:hypothetical protein
MSMTRHHVFFSPYFTSNEFQESDERKIEQAIENKCNYALFLITRIWQKPKNILKRKKD